MPPAPWLALPGEGQGRSWTQSLLEKLKWKRSGSRLSLGHRLQGWGSAAGGLSLEVHIKQIAAYTWQGQLPACGCCNHDGLDLQVVVMRSGGKEARVGMRGSYAPEQGGSHGTRRRRTELAGTNHVWSL